MKQLWITLAMAGFLGLGGTAIANGDTSGVDQNFVEKATLGNLEEVQNGQLAQQKTSNTQVLNVANTLINDHSKANKELSKKAMEASINVPNSLDSQAQERFNNLNILTGKDFERQYLQSQIEDHEQTIKLFKFEAANGKNSTLKNFASNTIPTLQNHLNMTRQALDNLDKNN